MDDYDSIVNEPCSLSEWAACQTAMLFAMSTGKRTWQFERTFRNKHKWFLNRLTSSLHCCCGFYCDCDSSETHHGPESCLGGDSSDHGRGTDCGNKDSLRCTASLQHVHGIPSLYMLDSRWWCSSTFQGQHPEVALRRSPEWSRSLPPLAGRETRWRNGFRWYGSILFQFVAWLPTTLDLRVNPIPLKPCKMILVGEGTKSTSSHCFLPFSPDLFPEASFLGAGSRKKGRFMP